MRWRDEGRSGGYTLFVFWLILDGEGLLQFRDTALLRTG
jgi:hypothetical protein